MIGLLICDVGLNQAGYQITTDTATHEKMLVGTIQKSDIASDPAFKWYKESQQEYTSPDLQAVQALRDNKDHLYLMVFGATWCEDSHFILPRLFKIQEVSGFPENHIALFALNREKEMGSCIARAFGVTHTPTIVVMQDGKERGRVVEYGCTGKWEQELAEIINHG